MKKILALAIASAFAAPAFAATANVDVYGKLHMSFSQFDDQEAGAKDQQISSNASRIGFKGAEDLGGGLAAIWQLEQTVTLDEGGGSFATRNSFIGLKSNTLGTVIFGNNDTPLKSIGRKVDLFGDTVADSRNVNGFGSDTRAKNTVQYTSPSFSGLSLAAAYSTDPTPVTGAADQPGDSAYNLSAAYNNGPLFLGLGYGDGDGHEAAGLGKQIRAAGGFTFGDFKIVGQYDKLEDDTAAGQDIDAWMVGGAYSMGAMVFKANYMKAEADNCVDVDCEAKQWTVGMDYNLSKRTAVYALYANGENVTFGEGVNNSDHVSSGQADLEASVISLGMIHSF